jgi:hypothetical protein
MVQDFKSMMFDAAYTYREHVARRASGQIEPIRKASIDRTCIVKHGPDKGKREKKRKAK